MEPLAPVAATFGADATQVAASSAAPGGSPAFPGARVVRRLQIGTACAVAAMLALSFADAFGELALWRNGAVTFATLVAAAAAVTGRRVTNPATKRLRTALAGTLVAIALAQLASDIQAAIGWEAAPRPSDAIGFASAIPTILAFTLAARVRLSATEVLIVVLDGLTVFIALWVVLLLAAPLAEGVGHAAPDVSIVLLAGSFVATILCVAALWTLARRSKRDMRGLPLFVLGLGAITISWVAIIGEMDGSSPTGHAIDVFLVGGILLAGYGATTATLDVQEVPRRSSDRPFLVAFAPTIVPIACVALMAVLLFVHAMGSDRSIVAIGGGSIVLVATVRMLLLVWERTGLLWRTQVARDEAALLEQATAGLLERLDPAGLMQTLAIRAAALLEADEAFVYLVDDDGTRLTLEIGTAGLSGWLGRTAPVGVGIAGRVLETRLPSVVNDPARGPAATHDLPPYAAAAAVPLASNDAIAGVLGLLRKRAGTPFDAHDLAVLKRLGQLGSIALDNARLYGEARAELFERRLTEAALREAEQKFRSLVEQLPGAVYLAPVGAAQPAYVSPQIVSMTGYGPEEVMAQDRRDEIIHPDDRDRVAAARALVINGATTSNVIDYRIVTRDGRTRWFHEESRLLVGSGGQPAYWQGFVTDVTERLDLQERLRQAAKMEAVGRLAGGVAHDFNNLLTAIGGFAELLSLEIPGDAPSAGIVAQIRQASDRASTLTRQLLTFSRRQVLQPTTTDLNAVVAEIEPMLRRLIGEHITIEVRLAPNLPPVLVDRGQIDQMILNLALNARDAMPDGGRLTLSTAIHEAHPREEPRLDTDDATWTDTTAHPGAGEPGDASAGGPSADRPAGPLSRVVALTVADTGAGMSPEIRDHIFEPFFTTKEPGRGTGLGLATVYGIVEQSGGRIEFTSEAGKGTSFTVTLPEVRDPARSPLADRQPLVRNGAGRILLVEDDAAVRRLVETILVRAGFHVTVRPDADAAIRALDEGGHLDPAGSMDLAVLDVVMPGMSGPVLAARLLERLPGMGLLFMSGYPRDELSPDRPLPPGSGFIAKPFTGEELVGRVNELLAARSLLAS